MTGETLMAKREAAFFASLRLSNGTFKTTGDHRMDDLNAFVIDHWKKASVFPAEIMDVGASSGISTVECSDMLKRAGFDAQITATDLTLWANRLRLAPGLTVLEDDQANPLQYVLCGIALRPWHRRLDYITGYGVVSGMVGIVAKTLRNRATISSRVPLVSQRALNRSDISWAEDNVLMPSQESFVGRFDAIRAANILNLGYFSTAQIRTGIQNLKRRLRGPGTHLLVNRTVSDGSNHATLFRLTSTGRFEANAAFGQGSEIADIVLGA